MRVPKSAPFWHDSRLAVLFLFRLESSNQTQRFRAVNLVRRPVAQAFARPAVELIVRLLHALLAHARQRFAFRKVLAQEAVGVLVGAAAPEPPLGLAPADAAVEAAGVDAAIDGGVADGASAQLEREPALYLLGRPLLLQELVPDQVENALVVERAPPAAREPAPLMAPLRGRGAEEPLARVALELARRRRFAAPDGAGDLGDAPPVASHQHDVLALA